MISVLAQERLLGAAVGSLVTGIAIFEQRRYIYKTLSGTQSQFIPPQSQIKQPVVAKKCHSEYAHLWNKAVDETFGPLIESLSSRGC